MQWFAEVIVERRCPKCGTMVSATTISHGGLADLAAGTMCYGKGTGRDRVTLWLRKAHTIRRTGEVVPSPWDGRKATATERAALADLVTEAKAGKAVRDRLVDLPD